MKITWIKFSLTLPHLFILTATFNIYVPSHLKTYKSSFFLSTDLIISLLQCLLKKLLYKYISRIKQWLFSWMKSGLLGGKWDVAGQSWTFEQLLNNLGSFLKVLEWTLIGSHHDNARVWFALRFAAPSVLDSPILRPNLCPRVLCSLSLVFSFEMSYLPSHAFLTTMLLKKIRSSAFSGRKTGAPLDLI